MSTNTHVNDLKINKLKEAQFDAAVLSGVIDETQLSIITDAGLSYNELEDLPQPVQVTSLPTAGASEVGNIYQFTGTTGTYTNGYFYKCVSDGAVTPAYSWEQVNVQPAQDPLPSQTGNSGKFLTTNGSSTSWATVDALPAQSGQSGKFLTTNGTNASWATISALQNTATGTNALTILGTAASSQNATNIGTSSTSSQGGTSVGYNSQSGVYGVAIGNGAKSSNTASIAIGGNSAQATGFGSIMIGTGTNSVQKTLKIGLDPQNINNAYELLSANGTIPEARMADTTNAASGQVLKLDSNLDAQWTTLSTSDITNDAGYITGINSTDVTTALGYTPYNATNPNGYQANVIESISVNNTAQTITSKNVNITVPTTAADVSALPSSTKYAASMTLSINSTTYVVTAQLKDQDGNNLGTAQTIDLPLESVVVNGEYDSVHKKIILTLQNGTTIEFSVADLVSGLQSEITSSNKLDADLVDDSTSTNKFVTASDKTTWSGKQDALVSGTNIKTVNGNSLLGSGNIALDTLPDQTGNSGKFLKTNGTTASWANGLENLSTAEQSVSILGTGSTLGSGCINIGTRSNTRYGGIALGYEASCTGNIGIALSQYSLSAGMGSVAIGYNAKATVDYAIQMGGGTNNTSNTFQVYNYRLMNADGTIPEARLASTSSATAGQALVLDSNLDAKWTTIDALPSQTGNAGKFLTTDGSSASWATVDALPSQTGQSGKFLTTNGTTATWDSVPNIQTDTIPTAGSSYLGKIYQYTGTTDTNYTNGYFYQCISDGASTPTYSWTQVNVQPAGGGSSYTAGTGIDITSGTISVIAPTVVESGVSSGTTGSHAIWGGTVTDNYSIAVGNNASASDEYNIVIGNNASAGGELSVALGQGATAVNHYTTAIGAGSYAGYKSTAIGRYCSASGSFSTAIGWNCRTNGDYAIQLGGAQYGVTNSNANTIKYSNANGNFEIVSADGTIPEARLADTTNAAQGQALVLDSNLNAIWTTVDGLPSQSGQSGKYLTTNGTSASWATISTTLSNLTDVTITSASSGQVLSYNGTNWENSDPTPAMVIVDYTAA